MEVDDDEIHDSPQLRRRQVQNSTFTPQSENKSANHHGQASEIDKLPRHGMLWHEFPSPKSKRTSAASSPEKSANTGVLKTESSNYIGDSLELVDVIRNEVTQTLADVVYSIARATRPNPYPARPKLTLPHPTKSEIEVCVCKASSSLGLCMKVGNYRGRCVIIGFRPNEKGQKGINLFQ
jgi:hypothetical protein